jgi:2,3-bisphosphoglycerate-independent phosphoglycerate mutase
MQSGAPRRPLLLIIRDGWGYNPDPRLDRVNATKLAKTPVDDELRARYAHTLIHTYGEYVGLPDGTMGNSEVGHQNIGAGRTVDQESVRITKTIRDGSFFQNPVLVGAVQHCLQHHSRLHAMGLASDIGVHSLLPHLYATVELAARQGLHDVFVHAFTDGRDSPPTSGKQYLASIQAKLAAIGVGRLASVCGRFYAMDRDNRWDRVERAYRMLTAGEGWRAPDGPAACQQYYDHPTDHSMFGDEFIVPTVLSDDGSMPRALIDDADAVVFFNFRGDRPRELIKAFQYDTFPYREKDKSGADRQMGFARPRKLNVFFVGMTEYEQDLPVHVAFARPPRMVNIAGEYLSQRGLLQFRCAETEKYAHVTFFFNDYREEPFAGEERTLIPSPKVRTYDQQPEMSAYPVTDEAEARIRSGRYDFVLVNYANPDMVGHTGVLSAAVKACQVVDECVGRLVRALREVGGVGIVTADHGNFELMVDPATGQPHTAHTVGDVPLIVVDDRFQHIKLREGGVLADVMPTALVMMDLPKPEEMTGRSLIPL